MRVLLIGSGGRENAIAWSVYASPLLEKLYCIPGNPGIKEFAVCIDVNIKNYEKIYLHHFVSFRIVQRICSKQRRYRRS